MMQTRSNSGPVEDLAMDQALRGDNKNAKSTFSRIILEAPQKLARSDALPESKNMQLLGD